MEQAKKLEFLVVAKGDNIDLAKEAGADYYGAEEYLEKIKEAGQMLILLFQLLT